MDFARVSETKSNDENSAWAKFVLKKKGKDKNKYRRSCQKGDMRGV